MKSINKRGVIFIDSIDVFGKYVLVYLLFLLFNISVKGILCFCFEVRIFLIKIVYDFDFLKLRVYYILLYYMGLLLYLVNVFCIIF